jgi:acetyl/propionyl-CoA carboxylase alpha subunit
MTFEVEIAGARRAVSIEPAGHGHYRIVVDGTPHHVQAERVGEFGLAVIVSDGAVRSREVNVAPGGARGELLVELDGRTVPVVVDGRRRRAAADGAAHGDGERSVVAPMPGRVVRVLVAAGDEVALRQGLVVVEAMKMENELGAPRPGRVKDVLVTPGTLVEAGRVLVVIE